MSEGTARNWTPSPASEQAPFNTIDHTRIDTSQPVPDRHWREVAGKPELRLIERRSLDLKTVDRVRSAEHDHRQPAFRRLLEDVGHRGRVGIEARADILQIDDECVEAFEHRRRRPACLTVERVNRQPRLLVSG